MIEQLAPGHYRLHGQLSMRESAAMLQELMAVVPSKAGQTRNLQLDVSGLASSDSVLLAAILELGRRLAAVDCHLQVVGLPDNLAGLARVYGIESLMAGYR